jgi:hypothetical protein
MLVEMSLDHSLQRRLDLLRQSEQIDPEVANFMTWALEEIGTRTEIEVREETVGTLCTHTSLALQRARDGAQVESGRSRSEELAPYPWAVELADSIVLAAERDLGARLSQQEREFIALHLAAASQERS